MIKTLFLGTPVFAENCLKALIEDPDFDVTCVITQPDKAKNRHMKVTPSHVKKLALKHKIPVLTPEKFKDALKEVKNIPFDVAIVIAYGQILPPEFLNMSPHRVVNIHGSLLPHLRGAAPIQRALMRGDKKTGVTLQKVAEKLDTGDIISQKEIDVDDKNAREIFEILEQKSIELLTNELKKYLKDEIQTKIQDESLSTYASKIEKKEAQIHWDKTADEIHNQVRGLFMGPQAFCYLDEKKSEILKITKTKAKSSVNSSHSPGDIIEVAEDSFTVFCAQHSALQILRLQKANRKEMSVTEYLKGFKIFEGQKLY